MKKLFMLRWWLAAIGAAAGVAARHQALPRDAPHVSYSTPTHASVRSLRRPAQRVRGSHGPSVRRSRSRTACGAGSVSGADPLARWLRSGPVPASGSQLLGVVGEPDQVGQRAVQRARELRQLARRRARRRARGWTATCWWCPHPAAAAARRPPSGSGRASRRRRRSRSLTRGGGGRRARRTAPDGRRRRSQMPRSAPVMSASGWTVVAGEVEDRRHREQPLELLVRLDVVDPRAAVGADDVVAHRAPCPRAARPVAVLRHPRDRSAPSPRTAATARCSTAPGTSWLSRSSGAARRSAGRRRATAPKPVRADTMPGWSSTHSPMTAAPAPAGCARIAASTSSAVVRRHERQQLALVGDLERVETEERAGVGDHLGDRERALVERDARRRTPSRSRSARSPRHRGWGRAARGGPCVTPRASPPPARSAAAQSLRISVPNSQPLAHAHDRDAVHADVAADDHRVARARPGRAGCRRRRAPARCRRC